MFRIGLLLGFTAVFLQIAVFLQPLLPSQYQIAPVCETITRALFQPQSAQHHVHHQDVDDVNHSAHPAHPILTNDHAHQHDIGHQCQYCTVFGHLVLPPELSVQEVLDRIQVRLVAFQQTFRHVYFVLQRLFLLPQGRAPPRFA